MRTCQMPANSLGYIFIKLYHDARNKLRIRRSLIGCEQYPAVALNGPEFSSIGKKLFAALLSFFEWISTPMTKKLALLLIGLLTIGALPDHDARADTAPVTATSGIVAAANNFLTTLNATQRAKVVYDFKDEQQRKRWSNFPTTMVQRGGLRMGDLTKTQRDAVLAILSAALSPQGYQKVMQITDGDEILRGSGGRGMFGRDEYYVSFLGQPSATQPWMIQFGGHHLGINITLVGERGTLAPSHTGAQPAIYTIEGKTVRPLGRETDKALALMSSLDEAQRKQATLGFQVRDLVLGPGRDGVTIQPEGIKGSALNDKQRDMLLDLASEWTGILNNAQAKAKMDEMRQSIADTWFAWSGPVDKNRAAYFRIQGPAVLIEYAPQSLGGDLLNHTHTIYRDPANDYGAKWWSH